MRRGKREVAIKDCEISITGRLASMTRGEAIERIERGGARYAVVPSAATDYLVVGRDGWPLREDGRLTRSLVDAERLQATGRGPKVISEDEFVQLLLDASVMTDDGAEAQREFTIGDLSRILDVTQDEIRSWIRKGLVTPTRSEGRIELFSFRQVASARTLVRLLASGATSAEIRRSLEQLAGWLPAASGTLGQLQTLERADGELLVRMADGRLAEPSGQQRLDFEAAEEQAGAIHKRRGRTLASVRWRSPHDWFVEGVRAEERGELEHAADAYHEALLAGGPRPEICFNLGNVLHSMRRKGEAVQRFMQAVEIDPEYVEAWNNLGNALAELGRGERAVVAYRRALELEPAYADAHFNLAATLETLGRDSEAEEHWRTYLRQDPNSDDAEFVRERLARLGVAPGGGVPHRDRC